MSRDFSKFQKSQDWDGTGKHPILGKTKEEIMAMNEAVTEKHTGTIADTEEKKPQPSFEQETALQATRAQEKQDQFIENLTNALSSRKS